MLDAQSRTLPTVIPTELMSGSFLRCQDTKRLVVFVRNQYDWLNLNYQGDLVQF